MYILPSCILAIFKKTNSNIISKGPSRIGKLYHSLSSSDHYILTIYSHFTLNKDRMARENQPPHCPHNKNLEIDSLSYLGILTPNLISKVLC
jgi:hypothetical protein